MKKKNQMKKIKEEDFKIFFTEVRLNINAFPEYNHIKNNNNLSI